MSFGASLFEQAANLGVLLGFATGNPAVAIVSGVVESVLALAFPQDAVSTASNIAAIEADIQAIGDQILKEIQEDETRLTMADLLDSQDAFFSAQHALDALNADDHSVTGNADAANLRIQLDKAQAYLTSGTPEDKAMYDLEANPASKNDSLSMYLFAATLYMNWCKLGMMDQFAQECTAQATLLAAYRKNNPNWQSQPVPPSLAIPTSFADLTTAPHRNILVKVSRRAIAWAQPIVDDWTSANSQLATDVANRKADFSVVQTGALWGYRDAKVGYPQGDYDNESQAQMQMENAMGQAVALIYATFDQKGISRDPAILSNANQTLNAIIASKQLYTEPLVETITLTAGTSSITVDKTTGPSGSLLVPAGSTTIAASYQRVGGLNEPIASTDEFELQFVPQDAGKVSWTSAGSTGGTLTVIGLEPGEKSAGQLSLFHTIENHVDFGPVTVTLEVPTVSDRAGTPGTTASAGAAST